MARIRTIKPEFFSDEKLAPMSPVDRLVFLGLISMADDAGRLLDNAKVIDAYIFPCSEDTSAESLTRLAESGRVLRYTAASGQRVMQVRNWDRHQKVEKPNRHVLPAPPTAEPRPVVEASAATSDPLSGDSPTLPRTLPDESATPPRRFPATILDLGPTTKDQGPPTGEPEADPLAPPPSAADASPPRVPDPEWREWVVRGVTLAPAEVEVVRHHRALYPRRGPVDRATHAKLRAALAAYPPARIVAALDGAHADPWCQQTRNLGLGYVVRDFPTLDKYADKADAPPTPAVGAHAPPPGPLSPALIRAAIAAGGLTLYQGTKDDYRAKVDGARPDGVSADDWRAVISRVRPWQGLAEIRVAKFLEDEIAARLAARTNGASGNGVAAHAASEVAA